MLKKIKFPLTVKELGAIGSIDSDTYIVDYEKSELKGLDFIEYFGSISKICDIENYNSIDSETKYAMLNRQLQFQEFVMLPSLIKAFTLCLLTYRGVEFDNSELRGSFFTRAEINEYIERNKDKFANYIVYYESLAIFIFVLATYMYKEKELTIEELDKQFANYEVDDNLELTPPMLNAVLFEPTFNLFIGKSVNPDKIKYYRKMWSEKLFLNKNIAIVITNSGYDLLYRYLTLFEQTKNKASE